MLWPEIRVMLAVGGEDKRAQLDVVRRGKFQFDFIQCAHNYCTDELRN